MDTTRSSHILVYRRVAWLVALALCCGLWLQNEGIPTLFSNIALVKLLPRLVTLQAPLLDEVLGLRNRPKVLDPRTATNFAVELNRIRSPRLSGTILVLIGQPTLAEAVLRIGATDDAMTQFWLALALAQQNRREAAFQTIGSVRWADEYFARAGLREQERGHYETATRLLEMATMLDSGTMRYRALVYETLTKNTYTHLGDWEAAVHWADRWIQAMPDNTLAHNWLAALYLWNGQPEVAAEVLQRAEPYGIKNSRYYPGQMGEIYQSRCQWNLAVQAYREAWEQNKDDPSMAPFVAWYLGAALYQEGQHEEARFYLEVVRRTGDPSLQQQAADLLAKIGAKSAP